MKLIYARYDFPYSYIRAATVSGLTAIVLSAIACVIGVITGSENAPTLAVVATIFLMSAGCVFLMIHLLRLRGPDRIGRFLKTGRLAILLLALDLPFSIAAHAVQHRVATGSSSIRR